MIPPDRLRELRASRCLFVEGGGFPVLSYEAVLSSFDPGDYELNIDSMGLCGGYPRDPVNRDRLEVDGRQGNFAVRLGDELVGGGTGSYAPVCLLHGSPAEISTEDTSYVLDVVDAGTRANITLTQPRVMSTPHTILPHLKVVRGRRSIARPLTSSGSELDAARSRWTHTYAWSVPSVDESGTPDPAGVFWRESYGPSVIVERVAFFVELGSGPVPEDSSKRDYVAADKLRVAEVADLGTQVPIPFDAGCDATDGGIPTATAPSTSRPARSPRRRPMPWYRT